MWTAVDSARRGRYAQTYGVRSQKVPMCAAIVSLGASNGHSTACRQGGELIEISSNVALHASVVDFNDSRRASIMTRCDSKSLSKSSCPA